MSTDSGDWFLFYDPDGITVPEDRFPLYTLVTGDRYDVTIRLSIACGSAVASATSPSSRSSTGTAVLRVP